MFLRRKIFFYTYRQGLVDQFNENPDLFVFLLSTRAGTTNVIYD